jgi:RNA polymerase sigma factor (sigma-70 family)
MQGRRLGRAASARGQSEASRKRAAIEMIAEHEAALKRTARRYSLDAEDAEDAYQRALEIVLVKAPTTDARELIRWTQTVTKHEALALRQSRERLLGHAGHMASSGATDLVALIPATDDTPEEQVERREAVARSREALQTLKPAELRALSLLAEGYSYAEIGEITGFSQTKINRVLAEGRDRFRSLLSSSEDGRRCRQMGPLLSAFCDGEVSEAESQAVREHLRACGHCRSTMRAYRAAPRIAIALGPSLLPPRSVLERVHELFAELGSRLPRVGGAGAGSAATQVAVGGGSKSVGMAALAKLLAVCGAAGVAAAGAATGVLPAPDLTPQHSREPVIERSSPEQIETGGSRPMEDQPAAPTPAPAAEPPPKPAPPEEPETLQTEAASPSPEAVEYEPPPPVPVPEPTSASGGEDSSSGSAAGEFGP